MKPRLKSSPAARSLIKRFEPYLGLAEQGTDGRWVVGYGHHASAKQDVRISEDEASLLLIYDVMQAEKIIDDIATLPLERNQRDALISFVHGIGEKAFRQSHVARYLYEGRAMAAAEAIASHGDTDFDRRDAESTLFLSESILPKQKPAISESQEQMVELVIKVEHPGDHVAEDTYPQAYSGEERVREKILAEEPLSGEVEARKETPPPPMPLVSTGMLEAEDEISRILEAAQTLPEAQTGPETEIAPKSAAAEAPVKAKPKPRVIASGPLDSLLAGRARSVPEPVVRADDKIKADQIVIDDPENDSTNDDTNSGETVGAPDPEPTTKPELEPEEAKTPDVETEEVQAPSDIKEVSPAEQVIARMAQQISDAPTLVEDPQSGSSRNSFDDRELPEGVAVGYVLAGGVLAKLEADTDEDNPSEEHPIAPELAAIAAAMQDDELAEVAEKDSDVEESSELAAQDGITEETISEPAEIIEPSLIVEKTVNNDKSEPPHPAESPAMSFGAVGEVSGLVADIEDDPSIRANDVLVEEMDLLEEDFSPSDLAGEAEPFIDAKRKKSQPDEGGWGFVAVLIAGLAVAGVGVLDVMDHWQDIWGSRQLTLGVGAVVAGSFLVIAAAWQLVSVMMSKLKA